MEEIGRKNALGRAERGSIPFGAVRIIDRDESRLAALGQAHIKLLQGAVDLVPEVFNLQPLFVGVGLGDARRFPETGNFHVMAELGFALVDTAADRRRRRGFRRAGKRDVAFAGEQAGGRVEADPASARQVDFGPRVQVGEILFRTGRTVQRLDVGGQLDQVAGNETRCQPEVAQHLNEQPGRVAAGAGALDQGFFRRLDAGFHADGVADVALYLGVDRDQKIDAAHRLARDAGHVLGEFRAVIDLVEIRRQLVPLAGLIGKGNLLGVRFEKEVKRIDHRHFGDQVDLDAELARLFREDQARQVIALRVLLPVDEVFFRPDLERVGQDARARMRAGTQADDLGPEIDQAIIGVMGDVI